MGSSKASGTVERGGEKKKTVSPLCVSGSTSSSSPPRWAVLGVSENPDKIPEHKRRECTNVQVKVANDIRGDKKSPKKLLMPQKL
jgi:hypothetical protein